MTTQEIKTPSRPMTLYYVEQALGCGLRAAYNLQQATAEARAEIGTANFQRCTKATPEQIAWVRGMGGYVPDLNT